MHRSYDEANFLIEFSEQKLFSRKRCVTIFSKKFLSLWNSPPCHENVHTRLMTKTANPSKIGCMVRDFKIISYMTRTMVAVLSCNRAPMVRYHTKRGWLFNRLNLRRFQSVQHIETFCVLQQLAFIWPWKFYFLFTSYRQVAHFIYRFHSRVQKKNVYIN